ncbi:prepilin-type N-terminal cleavage/methylation domain-containing protein [Clostridium sp.]|uniref:prepilin-type N-terminal cleavage/methylation domain-containing protein n=1 Tax=Clostridium sp. TaxID=1506 RepID=UPI003D6D8BCB
MLTNKKLEKFTKGFTLIELIIVISIIAILITITVPAYGGYIKKAKVEVCNANCVQLERMYEMHFEAKGIEHTDVVFEQFVQGQGKEICPEHGVITYVDEKVRCSAHTKENDEGDDDDVPYL